MRRYETIFITLPELSEEDHAELLGKLRSLMTALKGDIVKLEDWGVKKLGYPIRKNGRGRYFLVDFLATPELIRELERNLRLNDRVLKFQTVKISDMVSPEAAAALKESAPPEGMVKITERTSLAEEQEKAEP